ncbi:MAG TPA: hypothetical protein VGN12_24095 [Pirellulales bacterium]|jgi:hypothetical protein
MARAENQGLQIALIVFVMLTIILAVVTFMYVRSFQEARAEATKLKDTARDDTARAQDMQKEITLLKEMLGVDPKTIVGATEADEKAALTVKKTFEADMAQFAATLPPEKQHYRDALESIWQTNQELFASSTESQNNFKQLQDQLTRREEERDLQIKKHQDRADEQANLTVKQRGEFEEDRHKINATSEDLNTQLAKKDAEKNQAIDSATRQEQTFKGEIKTLATQNELKNEKIKIMQKSQFEVAQGEVVMVNPHKKGTVYLNIGAADHLIPLVTFSVHDAEANTAQGDGLKASIEVTQILGDHMSMCRVLNEDLSNPIANGDKVYTPLWHPGQRTRFAILGNIDLDGDGEDDRDVVRDLITSVGGIIDAEMDSQGKITGNVDLNTRYLLEGKIPKDRAAVDGAALLISKAELAGTERMPITKFMEQSGWKDPRQVVKFGRNGTRERIPAEPKDAAKRTATSKEAANFSKRKPWRPPQPAASDDK